MSELRWMTSLREAGAINAPAVIPTTDGRWIVYASGEGGLNDESPFNTSLMFSPQSYGEIWAQRLSDGLRVRLTHDKWEDGAPFWASPVSVSQHKK